MMEVGSISDTSVNSSQTAVLTISEDSHHHTRRSKNFKFRHILHDSHFHVPEAVYLFPLTSDYFAHNIGERNIFV
jgi:hypothetical protein